MGRTTRMGTEHERLGDTLDIRLRDGREFVITQPIAAAADAWGWGLMTSSGRERALSGFGFKTALAAYHDARARLAGGKS